MILYGLAADAVLVLHLVFILFVLLGGLLVLRWRRAAWFHLPAAAWGALTELAGWICPLTPLENWLRLRAGRGGYESDFVEHYLLPLIYPAQLTRDAQIVLGLLVIAFNAAVYLRVFLQRRRT